MFGDIVSCRDCCCKPGACRFSGSVVGKMLEAGDYTGSVGVLYWRPPLEVNCCCCRPEWGETGIWAAVYLQDLRLAGLLAIGFGSWPGSVYFRCNGYGSPQIVTVRTYHECKPETYVLSAEATTREQPSRARLACTDNLK